MTNLIESSRIQPPPGDVAELSLPLTFFDIPWLHFHPASLVLFYEFPCSKSYFVDILVPKLKQSLSLTLKHYLPLAGNLLYPPNTENEKPIIRYVAGDSVSFTVSESSNNFDNLVGNHARDADQFYDFVPQFPPPKDEGEYIKTPICALKVTLFPGSGLCFGLANHHCVGDFGSFVGFIKSWASISKLGGDEEYCLMKNSQSLPPLFHREVIKDPLGIDTIFWNAMKEIPPQTSYSFPLPTERVRATFVLHRSDIEKLKNMVLAKNPELVRISSFVVATTYVWTCFLKSGEEFDDDELFSFSADCKARIDPPVPSNYFGNCLTFGFLRIGHGELRGSEGFVVAATAMAKDIKNRLNHKDKVLKGVENGMERVKEFIGIRTMAVSGSPHFDLYSVDFGWGNARKLEIVSIDGEKYSMSLCKCRDSESGLEVGLSLPKERMESFAYIFADGLKFS